MQIYKVHINSSADSEMIWDLFETKGDTPLYSETADDCQYLFVSSPAYSLHSDLLGHPDILAIEKTELPGINWKDQWAMHPDYREGFVHVDLHQYLPLLSSVPVPSSLKLAPGPGFGDFSHPTTRLVLDLMPPFVSGQQIVDIGCGSGILSFAALAMGAREVCGIDIDYEALKHAEANRSLNNMEDRINFLHPDACHKVFPESVILMNMIQSEQEIALKSLKPLLPHLPFAVTSGILQDERDHYLQLCKKWGWELIQEKEKDGWVGFVFSGRQSFSKPF